MNGVRRNEHAKATKAKLYAAGQKLFLTRPYDEVTVSEIVRAAGVAKGSFYVHFRSKAEMILSLIADYTSSVDTDYSETLRTIPDSTSTPDALLGFIGRIAEVLVGTIGVDMMRLLYRLQLTEEFSKTTVVDYGRDLYVMVRKLIERGISRGEFRTADPVETAKQMIAAYRGLTYEWCVRSPAFDLKAEATAHFRLLISGLTLHK